MRIVPKIPSRFNIADWFLDRPADEHPERIAILGEPSRVSYGELRALANRVGNALLAAGCARGDRVLIVLRDSPEFIAAFFGATKIGALPVPVNFFARTADYAFYLSDSEASIAVVDESALKEFLPAAQGSEPRLIVVEPDPQADVAREQDSNSFDSMQWADWIGGAKPTCPSCDTSANDPAFLLYTSGSGGHPKAAVHQHKDMLAATRNYAEGVLGIRADDRVFSVSKLFFAYGLGNAMYFPLAVGASTILNPEKTRVDRVAELVAHHRPTIFFGVPTFYAALLREMNRGLPIDFSSVRIAASAGEPLPAEIFRQFRGRMNIEILDGIGSTEMLHIFISNRPDEAKPASCGRVVPGYQARITDETGQACGSGDIGNLFVKGESALAEYWHQPGYTTRVKNDGWVGTGDKFFCDADGFYHYSGRSDDMLKVSGMWVSPVEVEDALLGDTRIAEAAVVGISDGAGLMKPVAFVVLATASQPSAETAHAIQESLRTRLVHYKCPREIRFVDELPKTVTGKIQRYLLRNQLEKK